MKYKRFNLLSNKHITKGVIIKKSIYIFTFIVLILTKVQAEYKPFIEMQLKLVHKMNESNTTQDEIKKITAHHELLYIKAFESILLQKRLRLDRPKPYQKEIVMLDKLIKYNKLNGDKYAVVRDEVLIKSYMLLQSQDKMTKHVLRGLGKYDYERFITVIHTQFAKNQEELQQINNIDYNPILRLTQKSKTLQEAQKNIKDFYALFEINADMLKYYAIYEKRVYRLNKYADYHILPMALYLYHSPLGKKLNPILQPYNLSIVKLLMILFLTFLIYLIRTRLYKRIEQLLTKITHLKRYTNKAMKNIRFPINILFILLNIHVVLYIYNNFYNIEILTKVFNIAYAFLFTFILYRVLNSIASIRIYQMDNSDKKVKSEMINVGIKIVNFIILIMGILLVMHFAGANLATVLSGLGIGGFAIALAARESLSNFLGTISILMSDIFSQGDWIAVNSEEGIVVEIGLRVTTLRTFDNALVSIPNGIIANQDVKNWSRRTLGRRIKMSLGITYSAKPKDIHNAIKDIREMLSSHPSIATDKTDYESYQRSDTKLLSKEDSLGVKRTLYVYLDELAGSSINILVLCFTKKTGAKEWLETKEDVIFKIMSILEKNDLEFAYPSMSLYVEKNES